MAARCVATNPTGARCLYDAVHGNANHVFADSPDRYPFMVGKLLAAVTMYLDGRVDRDFLERTRAEVKAVL